MCGAAISREQIRALSEMMQKTTHCWANQGFYVVKGLKSDVLLNVSRQTSRLKT